jgi:glucose-6-phosphate 1-dehydrogenase
MNTSLKPDPTIFVIFGGTGDLNFRKLAPALYNLFLDDWLPDQFSIIGTGRTKFNDEEYKTKLHEEIDEHSRNGKTEDAKWAEFSKHLFYQVADAKDINSYKEFAVKLA